MVYFENAENLKGDNELIAFKQITSKSEFEADKTTGFTYKEIKLSDIGRMDRDEYIHPYLR